MKKHSTSLWLIMILVLSFVLKLICWYLEPIIARDGALYVQLAQIWYENGNPQAIPDQYLWIPPLPVYLMQCLMHLGLSAEHAGVWLNLMMGTFTPLLAYGIAYEITQRKDISLCSALLLAVCPFMNDYSHQVLRDVIYLFLIGVVIWLLAAGIRRQKWGYWLGTGLVCGCALLIRFESMDFFVIAPMTLLFLCMAKYFTWKRSSCYLGVFLLAFIGSIFFLTLLMQVQDRVLQNYNRYFQNKLNIVKEQIHSEIGETKK